MAGKIGIVRAEWNVCINGERIGDRTLVTEIETKFLPPHLELQEIQEFMRERMSDHFAVAVSFVPTQATAGWWTEVSWDTPNGE